MWVIEFFAIGKWNKKIVDAKQLRATIEMCIENWLEFRVEPMDN